MTRLYRVQLSLVESYAKQFLSWGQIVTFSPGTALFLPGVSKETKENFAGSQSNTGEGAEATADIEGLQSAIFDKSGGKLYAFTPAKNYILCIR